MYKDIHRLSEYQAIVNRLISGTCSFVVGWMKFVHAIP